MFFFCGRQFARHLLSGNPALGRETLAALRAAGSDDLAATLRRHARTEAVATLANKLGWLVGTLHLFKHRGVRPFLDERVLDVEQKCLSAAKRAEPSRTWPAL